MATKPHKSLTGSDLHEPKGVELAAAGQVYVADGVGSGAWVAIDIQASWSTGDVKLTYKTAADSGWLMMNDTTSIGNTGSGATLEGGGYNQLFTLLWNSIPATWGLIKPTRGGSAAADWTAGKQCFLPKTLGRALAVAGAGVGLTSRDVGAFVGEEAHALTGAENGPHTHTATGTTGSSNQSLYHYHQYFRAAPGAFQPGGEAGVTSVFSDVTTGVDLTAHNHSFSVVTTSSGTGQAHNTMQPTAFLNAMIKI